MTTARTLQYSLITLCATVLTTLAACQSTIGATTYSTDFENFALGGDVTTAAPILVDPGQGSNNWRGNGSSGLANNGVPGSLYDAEIVDLGGTAGKVYRLSNAKVSGNYDTTHAATPFLDPIGETASGGTPGTFSFSFDFRSVSSTLQNGLLIDVTPFESNSSNRQGIIRITDDATDGLRVGWYGYEAGFVNVPLATGLARDEWHTVSVEMTINDGTENDTVLASVNGIATAGLTSWEGYYAGLGIPSVEPIDSLIFRVASPVDFSTNTGGVAALQGGGIYFDNLSIQSQAVPEPSTIAILGLAGVAGLAIVRRRQA